MLEPADEAVGQDDSGSVEATVTITHQVQPQRWHLDSWPDRACLEDECLRFPRGTIAEQGDVFWSRDGRWALARLTPQYSKTGDFPSAGSPPQVLVDLEKRRLRFGTFPLGRDLSRALTRTPCSHEHLAVELGPSEWLCIDSRQASRHHPDGGVQRCVSSRSTWLTSPEGMLFEHEPGPFAWEQTAACAAVFDGVSVMVPGTERDWDPRSSREGDRGPVAQEK